MDNKQEEVQSTEETVEEVAVNENSGFNENHLADTEAKVAENQGKDTEAKA